jgi:hypothetical protein
LLLKDFVLKFSLMAYASPELAKHKTRQYTADQIRPGRRVLVPGLPLAPFIAISTLNQACGLVNSEAQSQREIYLGVALDHGGWNPKEEDFDNFEKLIGKGLAIRHWYQDWSGLSEASDFPVEAMSRSRDHGSIPMVTWMPEDARLERKDQQDFSLKNIKQGRYEDYIKGWAHDAAIWGHPFFLRFAHEMNGNENWAFPWVTGNPSRNNNHSDEYIAAWRYVHDIFRQEGARPTWVWNPDTAGFPDIKRVYPGDDYVDWTALDGYNIWNRDPRFKVRWFKDIFSPMYQEIKKLAPAKPVMIAETGTTRFYEKRRLSFVSEWTEADWYKDTLEVQIPDNFPGIHAVVFFNRDRSQYFEGNWIIEQTEEALQAFRQSVSSDKYKGNAYASLNISPIPPAGQL